MRLASILLLLLAFVAIAPAVTNVNVDISSSDRQNLLGTTYQIPITSTESTVTFTIGKTPRKIMWYTRTYSWGHSRATGAFATKTAVDADRVDVKVIAANPGLDTATVVYYVQAESTSDTILCEVIE